MSGEKRDETALGVARTRFVEGLERKAAELRGSLAVLAASPDAEKPREELRRRLHALYASAQVFRLDGLAGDLKDALGRVDRARDEQRALTSEDLAALQSLARTLPAHAHTSEAAIEPSAPRAGDTVQGVGAPTDAVVAAAPRPSGSFTTSRRPSGSDLQAQRPQAPLRSIVSVLVIDSAETQAQVHALLSSDRFEVLSAADPEEGLRVARSSAPDVVLLDRAVALRPGADFVARLRSDPLTDFVPVALLVPEGALVDPFAAQELGADDVIQKPLDAARLWATIGRLTGTADEPATDPRALGDVRIDELVSRVLEELRLGLVGAVEEGRDLRVSLGDGSEVLAATWGAVAKIREYVTQRSGGRVRFRDGLRRGGAAHLAMVTDENVPGEAELPVSLAGRRIVLADDDPGVLWFFAGLLREEGAQVVETSHGREALQAARTHRPDVIISDVLMPELDGFGLCRELARDPALADVPVILLSWKEDLLQRMRDLKAGARGYLRKEEGSTRILQSVREVLRPRARVEAQLRTGGDVRGRVDGLGVVPLLRTVARERPNARLTIRDAWNLFEVDMREGRIVDVTCTASDGAFRRGDPALVLLFGVTAGRFSVVASDAPLRATIDGSLDEALARGTRELSAWIEAVSGSALMDVSSVQFDPEMMGSFVRTSPPPLTSLVDRLRAGESPNKLVVDGAVSADMLERLLVDLVRRGALLAISDADGGDLVAKARVARAGAPATRFHTIPPERPTAVAHVEAAPPTPSGRPTMPLDEDDVDRAIDAAATEDAPIAELRASLRPTPPSPAAAPPPDDPGVADTVRAEEVSPSPARLSSEDLVRERPEPASGGRAIWIATVIGLAVVSFFGATWIRRSMSGPRGSGSEPVANTSSDPDAEAPGVADAVAVVGVADAGVLLGANAQEDSVDDDFTYAERIAGRVLPYLDAGVGATVGPNDGMLVLETDPEHPPEELRVAERTLGPRERSVLLPLGRYEIEIRRGDERSYRYVAVRRGETVVLPVR